MKRPLAVIIITKDRKTGQEIHNRFDAETRFPRIRIVLIALRAFFSL